MQRIFSWQANSRPASQEIPLLLWNPKVHYRVQKSLSLIRTLSQMNPVHTFPTSFPKIHSSVILSSKPMYSDEILYTCHISPIRAAWPVYKLYFGMMQCGNIVPLIRFFDVAEFTTLALLPLSLSLSLII
jgi:hypothetical protein